MTKYRDIRVRIVLRRELGREPTDRELSVAVNNFKEEDYKDVSRDEIIQQYEQGHEVRKRRLFSALAHCVLQTMFVSLTHCVGYDVAFMREVGEKLPAYLARRGDQNAGSAHGVAGPQTHSPARFPS